LVKVKEVEQDEVVAAFFEIDAEKVLEDQIICICILCISENAIRKKYYLNTRGKPGIARHISTIMAINPNCYKKAPIQLAVYSQ
jgi:hypothetical protein